MEAENQQLIEAFDRRVERRNERRDMFRMVLGAAVGGAAFAYANEAAAQATVTDPDILNFALNLEYLEAQFYAYAATGAAIAANLQTPGSSAPAGGTQGGVVIRSNETGQPRAVNFGTDAGDRAVAQYAREIAEDERLHVAFLRTALGNSFVAQPALNISGGQSGAFTQAARAAGFFNAGLPTAVATAAGLDLTNQTFDPYANSNAFLLGAFIFEDVGVTAYKGASPLITNRTFLQAAAGILAVEAYHAAIVRTTLYARGVPVAQGGVPELRTATRLISDARDGLDGTDDRDQGVEPMTVNGMQVSNIVPLDPNGLAYSRSPGQVLNIVYLNRAAVTAGGFFPAGVNGTIRAAAASGN